MVMLMYMYLFVYSYHDNNHNYHVICILIYGFSFFSYLVLCLIASFEFGNNFAVDENSQQFSQYRPLKYIYIYFKSKLWPVL